MNTGSSYYQVLVRMDGAQSFLPSGVSFLAVGEYFADSEQGAIDQHKQSMLDCYKSEFPENVEGLAIAEKEWNSDDYKAVFMFKIKMQA